MKKFIRHHQSLLDEMEADAKTAPPRYNPNTYFTKVWMKVAVKAEHERIIKWATEDPGARSIKIEDLKKFLSL